MCVIVVYISSVCAREETVDSFRGSVAAKITSFLIIFETQRACLLCVKYGNKFTTKPVIFV